MSLRPHISGGRILLQSITDESWYYVDVFTFEGNPAVQVSQVPAEDIPEDTFLGYIVLRGSDGEYYKLQLKDFEGDVFYNISEPLEDREPSYRLFLKSSNTGVTYEAILTLFEGEIYLALRNLNTNVTTIQSPFKELFTMATVTPPTTMVPMGVLGQYDVVVPANE